MKSNGNNSVYWINRKIYESKNAKITYNSLGRIDL